MAETLRIRLRKKDGILISWRNAVLDQNDRGLLSFLFKKAIIHYVKTGDTLCIGKIYLPDRILIEKEVSLNIFIGDSPEIMDLVSNNAKASLNLLREILKQSIQIADRMEEEWIPTYLDIEKIERTNHFTAPIHTMSSIPAERQVQKSVEFQKKSSRTATYYHEKNSGASPKASALFGKD